MVIQNDKGLVIASLPQQIPMPSTVIKVEVLAARRALELVLELGFDRIVLEGDSKILFKALKNGSSSLAHYGHLTTDIHFLISNFSTFKLSIVRRHYNKLVHSLVRRGYIPSHMSVRMEEIPLISLTYLNNTH